MSAKFELEAMKIALEELMERVDRIRQDMENNSAAEGRGQDV